MDLPFTRAEFFSVFARYNEAVWPAQVALTVLALIAVVAAGSGRRLHSDRVASGVLALLWLWMAIAYHLFFFVAVNPAAWAFALLFAVQATLLAWEGVVRGRLRFGVSAGWRAVVAGVLVVYALVVYPALGAWLGHRYPAAPTFGAPCPTTIFTIGLLLLAGPAVRRRVLVVPVIWAAIGSSAAFTLGVWQDLGLLAAGLAAVASALYESPGGEAASLYQRWVVANAWGEGVGLGATAAIAGLLAVATADRAGAIGVVTSAAATVAAGAAIEGATVGFAQAGVLKRRLAGLRTRDWVLATALGAGVAWALGMVPSTVASLVSPPAADTAPPRDMLPGAWRYVAAAGMGLALGPILAWPQSSVLRRYVHRARWWVAANSAAWAVGMPIVFFGVATAFDASGIVPRLLIGAGTLVATGAAVGAVHGAALLALLRRPRGDAAIGAGAFS